MNFQSKYQNNRNKTQNIRKTWNQNLLFLIFLEIQSSIIFLKIIFSTWWMIKINSTPTSDEIHSPPLEMSGLHSTGQQVSHMIYAQASKFRPRPSWCPPALKFFPSTKADRVSFIPGNSKWNRRVSSSTYLHKFQVDLYKFIFWIFMTYTALKFAIGKLISKANNAFHYSKQFTWFTKILLELFFAT